MTILNLRVAQANALKKIERASSRRVKVYIRELRRNQHTVGEILALVKNYKQTLRKEN
jgi:hypothetical protein